LPCCILCSFSTPYSFTVLSMLRYAFIASDHMLLAARSIISSIAVLRSHCICGSK
jgi:hypothetical protein